MKIGLVKLQRCRQTLGVNSQASKTDIRQAFLSKAKQWHPDRCVGQHSFVYRRWFNLEESYRLLMAYDSPAQKRRYYNGHRHTMGSSRVALVKQ